MIIYEGSEEAPPHTIITIAAAGQLMTVFVRVDPSSASGTINSGLMLQASVASLLMFLNKLLLVWSL